MRDRGVFFVRRYTFKKGGDGGAIWTRKADVPATCQLNTPSPTYVRPATAIADSATKAADLDFMQAPTTILRGVKEENNHCLLVNGEHVIGATNQAGLAT